MALPGPDAGAAPMAAFLSGRQDRSAAFQDGKKAVRNLAAMWRRPTATLRSSRDTRPGTARESTPRTELSRRPRDADRQAALETRIVAHDKVSRGCFIVARATPGASGRGFNSVPGSIARLQHDQACSRLAGLTASPGSTGQASGGWGRTRLQDRFKPQAGRQTRRHAQPLSQAATCCQLSASTTSAPSAARCIAAQLSFAAAIVS